MLKTLNKVLLLFCMVAQFILTTGVEAKASPEYMQKAYTALAASSCLGVYMPENSVEFSYLRSCGWNIAPKIARDGRVESSFAVAHKYFPEDEKLVFLVTFRGSATKGDWELNLKTKKVNYGGNSFGEMQEIAQAPLNKKGPAIHKGFNAYTENVLKNSVLRENGSLKGVFQVVKERPDAYLIITGHSLGGAAATLLGERLLDMGMPKEKFQVITFGAPAIANDAFVQSYGDRMKLLRIVNPNDPVPGSLQTFFNGYKQFGQAIKYQLPYRVSSIQHAMALYFDQSVAEYQAQWKRELQEGRMPQEALRQTTEGVPLVAVWFNANPKLGKQPFGEEVKSFVIDECKRIFPSYAIMSDSLNLDAKKYDNLRMEAKGAGADYILVCGIDGQRLQDKDYWYLDINQSLFDKKGKLLSMSSYGKKVGSSMSAIQAGGEILVDVKKDIAQVLPFVEKQHKTRAL